MSTVAAQRARFATTAASTASPRALLVMLYDRLVLDLERAEHAQRSTGPTRIADAHRHLVHAQDIISELALALDTTAWDGAPQLASLYAWLLGELVAANTTKDPERTAACRRTVEPLRDAWRTAAGGSAAPAGAAVASLGGTA